MSRDRDFDEMERRPGGGGAGAAAVALVALAIALAVLAVAWARAEAITVREYMDNKSGLERINYVQGLYDGWSAGLLLGAAGTGTGAADARGLYECHSRTKYGALQGAIEAEVWRTPREQWERLDMGAIIARALYELPCGSLRERRP